MPLRTRTEQLQWAKARALEYLPEYPVQALNSLGSDLGKHPETQNHPALNKLAEELLRHTHSIAGDFKTGSDIRSFIEGIN